MKCLDDCHAYEMDTFMTKMGGHEACEPEDHKVTIRFYEMKLDGEKIDGVTNEEVLRVLIHRLKYLNEEWQGGKFQCKENDVAIYHLEEALTRLEERTKNRIERGVEGTHKS